MEVNKQLAIDNRQKKSRRRQLGGVANINRQLAIVNMQKIFKMFAQSAILVNCLLSIAYCLLAIVH
jgi:hypothetical protein